MVGGLVRDLRFGLRTLARQGGFTTVAGLTLALGVGANTAVFSILNGVLLRPLDFPDAERIVRVWEGRSLSKATLASIRDQVTAFEFVAGYESRRLALTGEGRATELPGAAVAPHYFDVLGVRPARGRTFLPEEAEPGKNGVVIISHDLWRARFGEDPQILGRSLLFDGEPLTVVGVMPEGYRPVNASWEVWVPQTADPSDFSDWEGTAGTRVIAKLAPDGTRERANAELAPIARALQAAAPGVFTDEFVAAATVKGLQDAAVESFRKTLWFLLGAVTLVLLIACANVANLLLAKGESRSQELAVRRSLGASAGRLVRQLVTESVLLGLLGGGVGCLLAWVALSVFREHVTAAVPLGDRVGLNAAVLGFAFGASVLTALLFGLWPAIQAVRPDLRGALQGGGRSTGRGGGRRGMNRSLMAVEVALSLVLLAAAGLLVKSSWTLARVDPGFRSDGLLTLRVNLPGGRYDEEETRVDYFRTLQERLGAIPGVLGAGSMSYLPMTTGHMSTLLVVKDRPVREGEERSFAMIQSVMPGLEEVLGMRLLRGRRLEWSDRAEAPRVAVINEAMAVRAFGVEDPLGKEIQLFGWFDATVVGVVADVRETHLDEVARPEAFLAYPQLSGFGAMSVVIRTAGDPHDLVPAVVEAVSALDGDVPISEVATMDEKLRASVGDANLTMWVLVTFAGLALLLSAVGVYGVISYTVSERTHEIGVRVALGARTATVVREIVVGSLTPVGLGVVAGVLVATWLARVMESLLFEVHPHDPAVLALATVSLAVVAMAAVVLPAKRAASVDPVRCLDR